MARSWTLAAAACLLVAATLATIALNVAWASDGEAERNYRALSFSSDFLGFEFLIPYTADLYDGADGIGMARTAGVLWILGAVTAGAAFLLLENGTLAPRRVLTITGLAAAGVAAILLTVALVLLPLGIAGMHDDATVGGNPKLRWGAGLVLGIIAAVVAWAGAAVVAVGLLKESGFRLEPVKSAPDFDA